MSKKMLSKIMTGIFGLILILPTLSMAQGFTVNTHRFDPYKQFKFRVKWDGRYIPQIIRVSGLNRTTAVVTHRSGNEVSGVHKSPGQTVYESITIERGRTHDTAFEQWVNKVYNYGSGGGNESSLADFRKDIVIELYNEAGQLAMAFKVYRCWPAKYSAVNQFDAMSKEIALEIIVLEHEGWGRDYEVTEPMEPSFNVPE